MIRRDLKAFSLNLCVFLFLLSALPLPDQVSKHAGLMMAHGVPIGDMFLSPGGNLADQLAALIFLGLPTDDPEQDFSDPAEKASHSLLTDFHLERFIVTGDTRMELYEGVRNARQISDPSMATEGKDYAAYAFADYTVDYRPYITNFFTADGRVEVELSAIPDVSQSVQCYIPDYRTSDPKLAAACEREEARLLAHETEHYKAYCVVGETLADSLNNIRVTGSGSNLWVALTQARLKLEIKVYEKLRSAVSLANDLNRALDILTSHGLGIGPTIA